MQSKAQVLHDTKITRIINVTAFQCYLNIHRQDLAVLFDCFIPGSGVHKTIHDQFNNSRSINCDSYLYGWLTGPFIDFRIPFLFVVE